MISNNAEVEFGVFLARAVYGGTRLRDSENPNQWQDPTDDDKLRYGDNYRGFLQSVDSNLVVLTDDNLGDAFENNGASEFTDGGLYVSRLGAFEVNGAEALLIRTRDINATWDCSKDQQSRNRIRPFSIARTPKMNGCHIFDLVLFYQGLNGELY